MLSLNSFIGYNVKLPPVIEFFSPLASSPKAGEIFAPRLRIINIGYLSPLFHPCLLSQGWRLAPRLRSPPPPCGAGAAAAGAGASTE